MKMKMKLNKRHVTLLEMLITISLVTILLTALMGFYSFTSTTQSTVDQLRNATFRSLFLQHRLGQILPQANDKSSTKGDHDSFWFYTPLGTTSPELVFTYNNDADTNPAFSNIVLGKLFLDGDKLTLLSWSTQPESRRADAPARKEVFEEGITHLAFSFYNPPLPDDEDRPIKEIKDPPGWDDRWPIEKDKLPAMIKITITKGVNDHPRTYAFVMGNTHDTIFYTR